MNKGILSITKDEAGKHRVGKLITVLGCLTLTFGFYKEAYVNGLVWQDYIAYAISMTIMYAPAKAIDLINAIKGNVPLQDFTNTTTTKTVQTTGEQG